MKPISVLAPGAAAAVAAVLLLPPIAEGWVSAGWRLGPDQRDFRVWNNFTDPEANDNQTAHPAFPGWFGADMAIWKACVEWGSELHGDGSGDPHQPGNLGSGGANFDSSFQGSNVDAGEVGDNTFSELPGCSGGTFAFTESFISGDGWRTFFYQCWVWVDGPEADWNAGTGKYDLQGVATHEYGHALGLGHSADIDATMHASTDDGRDWRSIEADDTAGVQALYGVASPGKPRITAVAVSNGQAFIDGTNFAPTGNDVWFTRGVSAGDGTPIKVTDVRSSGGLIIVDVPALAGSGDILVRTGTGRGDELSNAWPFAAGLDCAAPTQYCTSAPNSVGPGATITTSGSQSLETDDFVLVASGSPSGQFGIFFYGSGQDNTPLGDGFLCVAGPFYRLGVASIDAQGEATLEVDLGDPPAPGGQITPGSTWNFQWWYRDPAAMGTTFNFSNGVSVPFCD